MTLEKNLPVAAGLGGGRRAERALGEATLRSQAEDLREPPRRRLGLQAFDRTGRQRQHPVGAFAAERLLPGPGHDIELGPIEFHREHRRGGVAQRQALAVVGDPVGVGNADARGGAVPGKDHVARKIDRAKVRQFAVVGLEGPGPGDRELFLDIRGPAAPKALPGEDVDAARSEQGPERALEGTRVRTGHQGQAVVRGHAEQFTAGVEHRLDPLYGGRGAVGASQQRTRKGVRGPSGSFHARPRRKFGARGF